MQTTNVYEISRWISQASEASKDTNMGVGVGLGLTTENA